MLVLMITRLRLLQNTPEVEEMDDEEEEDCHADDEKEEDEVYGTRCG
jgi:hypothetical protein